MHLTPREQEKIDDLRCSESRAEATCPRPQAQLSEAVAIFSAEILEAARDGTPVAEVMTRGTKILKRSDVMDGIPEIIHQVQVEATFPDRTKLVTVHNPIQS